MGKDTSQDISILQQYQNQIELISQQMSLLENLIMEYERAKDTVEEIGNMEQGKEILIPIGGNTFAFGTLKEKNKVITGIGGNISVEKKINTAILSLQNQIDIFRNEEENLLKLAQETQQKIDNISQKIKSGKEEK